VFEWLRRKPKLAKVGTYDVRVVCEACQQTSVAHVALGHVPEQDIPGLRCGYCYRVGTARPFGEFWETWARRVKEQQRRGNQELLAAHRAKE
jgi:hypothetical protein